MITTPQEVAALLIQNYSLLRGGHNRVSNSPHPIHEAQRIAFLVTGDMIAEYGIETKLLSSRYIMAAVAAVNGSAKRADGERSKIAYRRKNQLLDVILMRNEDELILRYFDKYTLPAKYRGSYLVRLSGWNAHILGNKIKELSVIGRGVLRLAYEDYLYEKNVGKGLEFPMK